MLHRTCSTIAPLKFHLKPFPHEATMADLFDNPMGTDGFEFVEYTAPNPELLRTLFERMGFPVVARHCIKIVRV